MSALSKKCLILNSNLITNRQILTSLFIFSNHNSTSPTDLKPQRISKNLSFRPATNSVLEVHQRPLVLIYGWLVAKAKHIYKYGDFYLGKGFDVLHIKVDPQQVLWPVNVHKTVNQIVNFVMDDMRRKQPILIHGFSVGGYLCGETLYKFKSDPVLRKDMSTRIRGQIFDSPVDYEGVPRGIGMALYPKNKIMQKTIEFSLDSYLKVFEKQVTQYYRRSSETFHLNPMRTPSLVFYSKSDPIGTIGPIETLMNSWSSQGISVKSRSWENTPHVSHFMHHPMEYIAELNNFLDDIGLQTKTTPSSTHDPEQHCDPESDGNLEPQRASK